MVYRPLQRAQASVSSHVIQVSTPRKSTEVVSNVLLWNYEWREVDVRMTVTGRNCES
jgi:hypothetical protein